MSDVRERPILFSGPMVRAILEGRKTQTRRVVKIQPSANETIIHHRGQWLYAMACDGLPSQPEPIDCPYGEPGDLLWVKETHKYADWTEDGFPWIEYAADSEQRLITEFPEEWSEKITDIWADLSIDMDGKAADKRWRPSIFMPRWASRITMEIIEVRVQRLQEITEADAREEGCKSSSFTAADNAELQMSDEHPEIKALGNAFADGEFTAKFEFMQLWDSINGKTHPWASNPWVWAVTFRLAGEGGKG